MTDLAALAERVEQAEGPSSGLDVEIGLAAYADSYPDPLPAYTASLDAAMTLVPEGWGYRAEYHPDLERGYGLVWSPADEDFRARGQTAALALVAAALRAARSHNHDD